MRIWWIAAVVAFGLGVLLVLGRGNPVQPSLEAVVGGGGGQQHQARPPRDLVGEAHLAAGAAQQALVRNDHARALMAASEARRALASAVEQSEAGPRASLLPLARHAETLEAMVRHRDPAATLSARSLAIDSFALYNRLAALPMASLTSPEPVVADTPPPAEPTPTARPAPAPTPGPAARHLSEARVHALRMQAWLEQEKYRSAWKAMRQLRHALGAAYQEADPAIANRLAQVDVQVLEVQKSPRTQMVARVLVIRRELDALQGQALSVR